MQQRLLKVLTLASAVVALGVLPASANDILTADVTVDCTSYTLNVGGVLQGQPGTVLYTLTLTPTSGSPLTVSGSIPVTPVNLHFSGSVSQPWSAYGYVLSGGYCVSGHATLTTADGATDNTISINSANPCFTCQTACNGTIGDFVWADTNRDGLQGSLEPGINGVAVSLQNSAGTIIATTTTATGPAGTDGYYQFTGLCAGAYTVTVTPPPGYSSTTPCSTNQTTANDSNCNPALVNLPTDNSSNPTIDFGFVTPQCAGTIGDFVWKDSNCNGIQDFGEPGLNGIKVNLKDSTGALVASTTTVHTALQDGYYQFAGVCAGGYTVEIDQSTLPAGASQAPCLAGTNRATDSNCSPAAVSLDPNGPVTDQTIDFGYCIGGGKTFSIGPSSMEGHLTILPGDWVSGGFSFKFKNGGHIATQFTVAATVSIDVTCPKGGGAGGTILVSLGSTTYPVPAGNTNWLPTGDQNSVLSWMGSAQAPDLCGGKQMDNAKGAVYKATVSQNPATGSLVDFRFKYRDPNAKGKGNVNCLDTTDPRRAKADVCGASWSQTVTDP